MWGRVATGTTDCLSNLDIQTGPSLFQKAALVAQMVKNPSAMQETLV